MKSKFTPLFVGSLLLTLSCGFAIEDINNDGFSTGSDNLLPSASRNSAIGWDNTFTGTMGKGSVLIGEFHLNENSFGSIGAGSENYITNSHYSAVLGWVNNSHGNIAGLIAGMGNTVTHPPTSTSGYANIVLGSNNQLIFSGNSDQNNIVMGAGNTSNVSSAFILGVGNIGQSDTVTLGTYALPEIDASLIVGRGTDSADRQNGLVVYRDGRVSIPGTLEIGSGSGTASPVLTEASALSQGFIQQDYNYNTVLSGASVDYNSNYATALAGGYASGLYYSTAMSGGSAAGEYYSTAMSGAYSAASYATAMSYGNAYADGSTAMSGGDTTGVYSTAMSAGHAIGAYSTAMTGGYANGEYSTAMSNGFANGYLSTAMSFGNASGSYSTAMSNASATGSYSTAMSNGLAYGGVSTAMSGGRANSTASYSAAISGSQTVGTYSVAMGRNAKATSHGSVALGRYNLSGGNTTAWVETDALLDVGNGTSSGNLSSAIITLKNGQSTLTNKAWKAHVAANPTNPAQALVDPPATTTDSGGNALVVEGHTVLKGKVVIEQPQGDISMGIYQ